MKRRKPIGERVDSLIKRRQDRERQHRSTRDIDAVLIPLRCMQMKAEMRNERLQQKEHAR